MNTEKVHLDETTDEDMDELEDDLNDKLTIDKYTKKAVVLE
jgi:hypothetical protein